jgi:hypothetical protein
MGVRLVRSRQKSYGKRATVQSSSAVRTRRFLRRERRMHFLWSAACCSSRFDRVGNKCRERTLYLEEAARDAGRIGASSGCVRRIRNRLLPLLWRRSSDHVPNRVGLLRSSRKKHETTVIGRWSPHGQPSHPSAFHAERQQAKFARLQIVFVHQGRLIFVHAASEIVKLDSFRKHETINPGIFQKPLADLTTEVPFPRCFHNPRFDPARRKELEFQFVAAVAANQYRLPIVKSHRHPV